MAWGPPAGCWAGMLGDLCRLWVVVGRLRSCLVPGIPAELGLMLSSCWLKGKQVGAAGWARPLVGPVVRQCCWELHSGC